MAEPALLPGLRAALQIAETHHARRAEYVRDLGVDDSDIDVATGAEIATRHVVDALRAAIEEASGRDEVALLRVPRRVLSAANDGGGR